jgi:hypothetical protein
VVVPRVRYSLLQRSVYIILYIVIISRTNIMHAARNRIVSLSQYKFRECYLLLLLLLLLFFHILSRIFRRPRRKPCTPLLLNR